MAATPRWSGLALHRMNLCAGLNPSARRTWPRRLKNMPPYWEPIQSLLFKRVDNPDRDVEFLKWRSPLFKADHIKAPLLVPQGANDVRVKQSESDSIVAAMRRNGKTVEYIVFPDQGHGFARPENRLVFYAAAEPFFANTWEGDPSQPPRKKRRMRS